MLHTFFPLTHTLSSLTPLPLPHTPHLSTRLLSFCGANLSLTMRAHRRLAALSLAISSKKLRPTAKKNERRGATWSTCRPAAWAHLGMLRLRLGGEGGMYAGV